MYIKLTLPIILRQVLQMYLIFATCKGQENVKRALEIAAAGNHNVLLIGSPGTGKTMLAQRMPSVLPDLWLDEALEVTKIHSIAGLLPKDQPLILNRPFRSPHHTISSAGLYEAEVATPKPGELFPRPQRHTFP